ncbi:adenosylcobinamide-phosphate synthase CbiB [Fusibacter sp. 3D3]|uniref:adenosylcobinamide-phosphate synthase CbiB n=1 Tax=Fusibacter sp. 3D3 TaxID=1048380 RepID=UPI0008576A87|nr:adenosylcobinamide-phosphate synthase CbiB [Fusibacter sp. 3D3]GAU77342.1 adenosylcobinamide-phosphate synthase [Fusibacter sp. 3D3]
MLVNIGIAVLLDWLVGDPPNWPHPVRFIGWLIRNFEKLIRRFSKNLYVGGFILMILTVSTVLSLYMFAASVCHPYFFRILNIYLLYTCLACKCLKDEAVKVKQLIQSNQIEASRKELSYLVGRDTDTLTEEQVLRGIIETVSENTVDGILAPLFYMLVGSLFTFNGISMAVAFALIYKSVNTLDSMVGYMQAPYKEIGMISAKTDDLLNFMPARLGAVFMLAAGAVLKLNAKKGFIIMVRDHQNHKSPNCGYPESVTAGLLGIQLGGTNIYFGEQVYKPTIGDRLRAFEVADIDKSVQVMYVSEIILLLLGLLLVNSIS